MKEIKILLFSYDAKRPNMQTGHGQTVYKSRPVTPRMQQPAKETSPLPALRSPGSQAVRLAGGQTAIFSDNLES